MSLVNIIMSVKSKLHSKDASAAQIINNNKMVIITDKWGVTTN